MTIRYEIFDKITDEKFLANEEELFEFIKIIYSDSTPKYWEFVLNRIVNSPRYPYSNSFVHIQRHNYNPKEKSIWKNTTVPTNKDLNRANYINLNFYNVFNKRNRKSATFNNLAALCRAMNLDYAFMQRSLMYSESLILGKYIFTKTQIPVNEYHKNKIQEIA